MEDEEDPEEADKGAVCIQIENNSAYWHIKVLSNLRDSRTWLFGMMKMKFDWRMGIYQTIVKNQKLGTLSLGKFKRDSMFYALP